MNNQMPFFMPIDPKMNNFNDDKFEKIVNKINRLEKNIRILDNRLSILESKNNKENKVNQNDDPTDMYII